MIKKFIKLLALTAITLFWVILLTKDVSANVYCLCPAGSCCDSDWGSGNCSTETSSCSLCNVVDPIYPDVILGQETCCTSDIVTVPCTDFNEEGEDYYDTCCNGAPTPDPEPSPGSGDDDDEENGDGDEGDDEGGDEIGSPISGTVKQDDGRDAGLVGGLCELGGASGIEPGEGSTVDVASITFEVAGDGTYTTPAITAGSYTVDLDVADTDTYTCTCPSGCAYGGISDGTSDVDFFVTEAKVSWFQMVDGSAHANSGGITSTIPDTADTPYLITGEQGLVSFTGSLDLGDLDETAISQTTNDWQAQTTYQGTETDYGYFARILSEDPDGIDDWDGSNPGSGVFLSLKKHNWWDWFNVFAASAETIETSGGDWTIPADQQTVLLTEKNVLITQNISVAEGGFLAIISGGDITIDDDVTNVEGVFIADDLINTCNSASDNQLNAEGIFVGWTGVNLCRDFDDTRNNDDPTEIFTYRPDLQVNAYNYLTRPKYSWQEIAP